jgi:hypothetical protein
MPDLWSAVANYQQLLDRADAVRARRGRPGPAELTELAELLTGPAITLPARTVPLEQRGLTGPATITPRITLARLVATLTDSYAEVVTLVTAAQAVLTAYAGPLDDLTEQLAAARADTAALGLAEPAHPLVSTLHRLDTGLDELRTQVFTDPLTLPADATPGAGTVAGLRAELGAVTAELARLRTFRDGAAARLRQAGAEVERVAAAELAAARAVRTAREKFATPYLPALTDSAAALRTRLTALAGQDWLAAADALPGLDRAVADAIALADRTAELATALLDRRAELRGRLDAYQAKAGRLGLAEDAELAESRTRAHELLWTSPCDLAAATRALNAYQRLLTTREAAP